MPEYQPIKRSNALVPLSREHHQALLAVWKIRQGLKKEVAPERIILFVEWFWQTELQPHFATEEQVLLPHIVADNLRNRLLQEHEHIAHSIELLLHNRYRELLDNLAQMLYDHIRFEERILFNEIEKSASAETLQNIGSQIRKENKCAAWADAFWET